MESIFSVFGEFLRGLTSFIPRAYLIRRTHRGVAFTRGHVKALGPGLHWYWPFWTELVCYPTVMSTVNLDTQTLVTVDGTVITVSGIITYEIDDIVQALAETYDIERVIKDVGLVIIKSVVASTTYANLTSPEAQKGVDTDLTTHASAALSRHGVHVFSVHLSDLCPSVVYRVWGDARPTPVPMLPT